MIAIQHDHCGLFDTWICVGIDAWWPRCSCSLRPSRNTHGCGRRLGPYSPKQHSYRPERTNTSREAHTIATLPKRKPTPTTQHHHHAISLLQPLAAIRSHRLQGPNPKRLLLESTPLLESLVASLLAPGMVEDPRQGTASSFRLPTAFPGPAEMLDAGCRAVSRVEPQHLRDATL